MTKHKAKILTALAVTVNDQRVSVSTMTQVDKKVTKAGKEQDDLETALDVVRQGWSDFVVITQAEGKQLPETETQEHAQVLGFIK